MDLISRIHLISISWRRSLVITVFLMLLFSLGLHFILIDVISVGVPNQVYVPDAKGLKVIWMIDDSLKTHLLEYILLLETYTRLIELFCRYLTASTFENDAAIMTCKNASWPIKINSQGYR